MERGKTPEKTKSDKMLTQKQSAEYEAATEEPYNPYEHRTGHVSNAVAFFHLVKCSIGSGILALPYGFKCAGMAGGFGLGIIVTLLVMGSFLILVKTMVKIAALQKVPYVSLKDAAKYSMEHAPHDCLAHFAPSIGVLVDILFVINYLGTCSAYYNYIIICTLTMSGYGIYAEGAVNVHRAAVAAIWFIPIFAINCVRSLKALGPASIIGNTLLLGSIVIIFYFILIPDGKGFSDTWHWFAHFETTPLYIGLMIFSLGSIGVCLAVEKDMKHPEKFGGWLGMFTTSLILVAILYLAIASLGYWKYGEDTKSTIVLTLPADHQYWLVALTQGAVGLALFLTYPLMCFVIFDCIWFQIWLPKLEKYGKKRKYVLEYLFRFGVTALTGLIGLFVPRLDIILSFAGSLALSFLALILPGILEYNYTLAKYRWKKWWILVTDIVIMGCGLLFLLIGTYSAIYTTVIESQKHPDRDEIDPTE